MTRFNRKTTTPIQSGPLTAGQPNPTTNPLLPGGFRLAASPSPVVNHQGGHGYTRDVKSDVFLLATTSLDLTGDAFYETANQRVKRYVDLIHTVAVEDPEWTAQFLTWLRGPGNIRTAAIVGAVEAARAMVAKGTPGGRKIVASVLQRPDEPGEVIAYHLAVHGRKIPKAIKRGVADAAVRLYDERALLKYDTASHGVRFGDVLDLTHPTPAADREHWQGALFRYAIDRRHGRDAADGLRDLDVIRRNVILRESWAAQASGGKVPDVRTIGDAGMTWEDVMSALGSKVDKPKLWAALIPTMGFMARVRNLRNFDETGVPDAAIADVLAMLTDPARVAKSRQLPLRFLSAHRAAPSLRWSYPLEQALDLSVRNIPALSGNTLIVIDTSTSMADRLSERSELKRWDAAVSFGLALARRCESAAVVSYASGGWGGTGDWCKQFPQQTGESLLKAIDRWKRTGFFIGGGTDTVGALRATFRPGVHHRVVLLTDEQDGGYRGGNAGDAIPKDVPLYTFNLAGYQYSNTPTSPTRLVFGGLTDAMFSLIPTIEAGVRGGWPWEQTARLAAAVDRAAQASQR